jgi:hypothetical protein
MKQSRRRVGTVGFKPAEFLSDITITEDMDSLLASLLKEGITIAIE